MAVVVQYTTDAGQEEYTRWLPPFGQTSPRPG